MATEVIMPKAGMAMEEGTVIKWFKKEGDVIEGGEPLLEILTDKVNMEVEAPTSGTLIKILADEGQVVPVITPIAYIGQMGEIVPNHEERVEKVEENRGLSSQKNVYTHVEDITQPVPGKIRATPAARRICRKEGIELSKIVGSGPKNRIQKMDVESYKAAMTTSKKASPLAERLAKEKGIPIEEISGSGYSGKVMKRDVIRASDQPGDHLENKNIMPLTPMRKVIGERISQSFFSAPTFTLNAEVDMGNIKALREELKDHLWKQTGCKLTYTDFIVMAVSRGLKEHPFINVSLVDQGILVHPNVNIALAVDVDGGLLVPVLRDVDRMSLKEIVIATKDIAERAKSMKLTPQELNGSTFTISNLGMYGISHFNPIINQPNSAILGVSTILDRMVVIKGEPQVRPMMNLSLTIDHRVIDGAPGARFLRDTKQLLENPMLLFI
ncbi:pyruvate dehydrogenase E2 component (dihydrolipoamide acetyltransferase) [Anaerosolibacter carboniphilus]|uniref:Dihydrolipoamide acetyltransferase component of pyruvate dehydrogenase complex n=1 Tax=Anaerosolibacter carboniphilus TaxID=1417629 RepID=A0A841KVK7_9FIRM|nr:dihydrolipoamide acetyltransferase family protein [Anaerosolibacter carboniphilus]MBB6217423.1 pyruvate dehydrogenase E2 component (dihydrolipoamide acetyltransferase) [Anaerosolibacter carboniphilus]